MATTRVVVVGANASGMSAAHQSLRSAVAHGRDLEVIGLETSHDTSYAACGIPYWIAGDTDAAVNLVARTADEHRRLGVDLRLGTTAHEIDASAGTIRTRSDDGALTTLGYDQLVLATGAAAVVPDWARDIAGRLIGGVLTVKSLQDGRAWIARLGLGRQSSSGPRPRRAVVVGGGYIGIEMAEVLMRRGLDVSLVTRRHLMSHLDPDMSARIEERVAGAGVRLRTDVEVTGLEVHADGSVSGVVTSDGASIPADVVVIGVGAVPNTSLGRDAGVEIGEHGGYLPGPDGQVTDGIWAVGDCCETVHRLTGQRVFVPLGTHANKLGRVAGENIGGGHAVFGGVLGTAITRFEAGAVYVEVSRTGLSTAEATAAGRGIESLVTEGTTASGYMPEANPIATKVLADPGTRELLGMQIVGGREAAKRIDAAAAALWGRMTVDDLAGMDLSYAPPFATAWEAVQIAARRLADKL